MASSVGIGSGGKSGGEKHERLTKELEEGAVGARKMETRSDVSVGEMLGRR